MILERLLGDTSRSEFLDRYFHRLPYSRPGGAAAFTDLGGEATIERILGGADPDVLVVRQGTRREGKTVPTWAQMKALHAEQWTFVARNAERHDAGLAKLAADFYADFRAPINIHLYWSPADQHGFGWHYDVEEVFVLQARGVKKYMLRKNSVNPWPLLETMPRDLQYEKERTPVMECVLAAGDWLYIPAGWWHVAKAGSAEASGEGGSISLAVGVMSPAAIAIYDFLRRRLLDLPVWRQRMPVAGAANPLSAEELESRYRNLFADLGRDLARTLDDVRLAREFLKDDEQRNDPQMTQISQTVLRNKSAPSAKSADGQTHER